MFPGEFVGSYCIILLNKKCQSHYLTSLSLSLFIYSSLLIFFSSTRLSFLTVFFSLNQSIYTQPSPNTGRALDQNFVFASLDNSEKQILTCAMETVMVKEGEELITQGY